MLGEYKYHLGQTSSKAIVQNGRLIKVPNERVVRKIKIKANLLSAKAAAAVGAVGPVMCCIQVANGDVEAKFDEVESAIVAYRLARTHYDKTLACQDFITVVREWLSMFVPSDIVVDGITLILIQKTLNDLL